MTSLSNLQSDDAATLFPALASLSDDGGTWRVGVSGVVYRVGRLTLAKKLMLGILRRAMRVERDSLDSELFRERVQGFLVEPEKGKRVAVRIGDSIYPLTNRTRRSGSFHEDLSIPGRALVNNVTTSNAVVHGVLPCSLVSESGSDIGTPSHVHFVPQHGVSIVSDIDDTLKETQVQQRQAMLVNTFLREFVPVDGMSDVLRTWQQSGAVFHYVSSSPWQLFAPLAKYFADEALPAGTFHLRAFRLRDHMLRRIFLGRRPVKGIVIRNLMLRFPHRKFILVGDSGEYDPEIYGTLARRFPRQVASILIRRVPGHPAAPFRWQRAFRRLDPSLWRLFDHAAEIENALSSNCGFVAESTSLT